MMVRRFDGRVVIFRTSEELSLFSGPLNDDMASAIDTYQLDPTDHLAEIDAVELARLCAAGYAAVVLPEGFVLPDNWKSYHA